MEKVPHRSLNEVENRGTVSFFYDLLETLTFHRIYIWNNNDESNLQCHPNQPYFGYEKTNRFKAKYLQNRTDLLELSHLDPGTFTTYDALTTVKVGLDAKKAATQQENMISSSLLSILSVLVLLQLCGMGKFLLFYFLHMSFVCFLRCFLFSLLFFFTDPVRPVHPPYPFDKCFD